MLGESIKQNIKKIRLIHINKEEQGKPSSIGTKYGIHTISLRNTGHTKCNENIIGYGISYNTGFIDQNWTNQVQ